MLEIPYGTRDYLPQEARDKRELKEKTARLFARYGYEEIETPTVEFADTLVMGGGQSLDDSMLKLFDDKNRALAFRHEMTTPIARLAVSRLGDSPLPLKLSYTANVFRHEETQAGRQCEFCQAGVELMGSASAAADAEVIALALKSIEGAGLENFRLSLGHVGFVQGLIKAYDLYGQIRNKIRAALEKHDVVKLEETVDSLDIPQSAKKDFKHIPYLIGGENAFEDAKKMAEDADSGTSLAALDNLREIYERLKLYGVADNVVFDLGVIRDFGYYTGMVFEVYAGRLGFPLAGGGRYDEMLSAFGRDCPATGFSLGIDRLLLAMKRQGRTSVLPRRGVYIAYASDMEQAALSKAEEIRARGDAAELAFSSQDEDVAAKIAKEKNYADFLYIK